MQTAKTSLSTFDNRGGDCSVICSREKPHTYLRCRGKEEKQHHNAIFCPLDAITPFIGVKTGSGGIGYWHAWNVNSPPPL